MAPYGMYYDVSPGDRICLLPRLSLAEVMHIADLVRALAERAAEVVLVAKREHARSVRPLFDGTDVRFKFVTGWDEVYNGSPSVLEEMQRLGFKVVPLPSFREACPYLIMGEDPPQPGASLAVSRNPEAEQALLERVRATAGTVYAVVHDAPGRRVRRDLIPDSLPVVSVTDARFASPNVFDWVQVIDEAVQFHGIDSGFLMMADALGLRCRKYHHAYASAQTSPALTNHRYRDVVTIW